MSGPEVVVWIIVLFILGSQAMGLIRVVGRFGGGVAGYAGARWTHDQTQIDAAKAAWVATWSEFIARLIIFVIFLAVVLMTPFVGFVADLVVALWSYVPQIDWEELNLPEIKDATPTPDAQGAVIRGLLG